MVGLSQWVTHRDPCLIVQVSLQDAFLFDYSAGVDAHGKFLGKPVPTGVRPRFTDRFDDLGITLSPRVFGVAEPAGARSWS